MVTMKNIAEHVGVSVSAVSLVLSGRSAGRVNPAVADRIRATADEFGYVPNLLARSLKTKLTRTIGLVADRVATVPFSGHMLAGAQEVAWESGFMLMLIDTDGNEDVRSPAVKALLQRNVEALIVATNFHRTVSVPHVPDTTPVVLLDGEPEEELGGRIDFVVPDEEPGAYAATRILLDAGHRRIGFCNVAAYPFATGMRASGYERALREEGIVRDPTLVVVADKESTGHAFAPAYRLLDRPDRPTAVFCFNDQAAMGFYHVARRLGLSIPRDLSLVGFDNQEFVADALDPGLTTVQLPHREMGRWAMRRVVDRLAGLVRDDDPRGHLMPCPLIVRGSVGSPPP